MTDTQCPLHVICDCKLRQEIRKLEEANDRLTQIIKKLQAELKAAIEGSKSNGPQLHE